MIRSEVDIVKRQILNIQPTITPLFKISHGFHMTKLDGKTFSALAEASTKTSGICRALQKNMNNIRLVKTYPIDADLLKYRLSTLPAWIRFFECILHIAYRLPMAGSGNTNDGNSVRRFFSQPSLVNGITGVCEELIYRISVILRMMASGHQVNTNLFNSYANGKAEIFVEKYPWFYRGGQKYLHVLFFNCQL